VLSDIDAQMSWVQSTIQPTRGAGVCLLEHVHLIERIQYL